jgi:hypothetical protein
MKTRTRLILALGLLVVPFAVAQAAAAATSGLLITKVNSQQWQIRLISSTVVQRFSGVVESDKAITAVQGYRLESADSAALLTPTSLGATFTAWPGGTDGVNFTASSGANLCLRDTGSTGVQMYLGDTLQNAIAVRAPVALAGTNACGGTTVTAVSSGKRKFHAGQWIVMGRGADSQKLMQESIKPGVVGLVKRYTWRSLEPAEGAYDFSELASDLDWAVANGMRLIAIIEDKTFVLERPDPAYLDAYTPRNRAGGYTVVRWAPTVVTRFNALVKAMGAKFDSNPNFEGIATQETALGLDSATLNAFGYTPEKYRDAYINMLTAATVSLPTSRVFWLMNFLVGGQNYIADIASAVAGKGVVMGGPDVWPDNKSLQSKVYPFYTQFYGKMPLFGQVENVCYSEPHMTSGYTTKYWTMPELFNYAVKDMHVNYMFWVRVTKPSPADAYDWTDALPVIAANPSFTP